MIVLAPEPADWLAAFPGARVVGPPEPLRKAWMRAVGARAERRMAARFWLRRAFGAWAAAALRRGGLADEVIVAPSLGARAAFAAARAQGSTCVLVEDMPDVRTLHADLDLAAKIHPDLAFLRRYRAPREVLVAQEEERALATRVRVRSRLRPGEPLELPIPELRRGPSTGTLLLAGPPVGRSGVVEAAAAARALGLRLVAPRFEVVEGPAVEVATREELALVGVDAVIAPAWAECWPVQVAMAAAGGLPVVATDRGAGLARVSLVERGDVPGLIAALT